MEEYRLIQPLGEGTFGQVYEAQHRRTLQTVAIKLVPLTDKVGSGSGDESDIASSNRELHALQQCQHPNVIALHGHFVHQHALALVLDHMRCDLAQLLLHCQRTATALTLPATRSIACQLLTAIAHIHSLDVLHRDIKPSNILLSPASTGAASPHSSLDSSEVTVQLADFGQASVGAAADRPLSPAVSTRWYKAPELLLPSDGSPGRSYGSAVDVWAAGCVLAECVSGAVLLAGNSDVEQLSLVAAMCGRQGGEWGWEAADEGTAAVGVAALLGEDEAPLDEQQRADSDAADPEAGSSRQLLDLLECMLQWEPTKRITAQHALSHPFLTRSATSCNSTNFARLLQSLEKAKAEQNRPPVSTIELLHQPFTIRGTFPLAAASILGVQHSQQRVSDAIVV